MSPDKTPALKKMGASCDANGSNKFLKVPPPEKPHVHSPYSSTLAPHHYLLCTHPPMSGFNFFCGFPAERRLVFQNTYPNYLNSPLKPASGKEKGILRYYTRELHMSSTSQNANNSGMKPDRATYVV